MKKILLILILLLPLCAFSQSRHSNKLYKQGEKLLKAEKYADAVQYFLKSDSLDKKILNPDSENYYRAEIAIAKCWTMLADENTQKGKYADAISLQEKATDLRKKIFGEQHNEYIVSLNDLAIYNRDKGNYDEAIRLGKIVMNLWKQTLGEDNEHYAASLNNLAQFYNETDNYTDAIKMQKLCVEICKKNMGEDNEYYALALDNLAAYYSSIGDNAESIKLGTIASEIFKNKFGETNPNYAACLNTLAANHSDVGNHAEAIRLQKNVVDICKNALGDQSPYYALALSNLSHYYFEKGDYTEALKYGIISAELRGKSIGEDHPNYAKTLCTLAKCYCTTGNSTEAIKLATKAMQIFKNVFGESNHFYALTLIFIARYNLIAGNYAEAMDYYKQGYKQNSDFILKNFSLMTNKERTNLWKTYSEIFHSELMNAAYKLFNNGGSFTDINSFAYNGLVFSKGLLLNAELEIQKLIEQSSDTTFVKRYYKIRQDRAKLDELYQLAPNKREINVDSLLKIIDNEEQLLVESSKELGDYTKNLSIDFKEIQKNLKDDDLAIEFANFKDTASKQQIYVALVLKKGMKSPELVKLFESDDFYDIPSSEYYKTQKLYNLVWKPLQKYLDGVQNVYFSPAGQLHTIGIEYLPDESGKIFAEKFNAYRLSSTRELALMKEINPNKKAATYGGIKYGEDNDSNGKRGVVTYLKGSKIESDTVAKLLRSADYEVFALSDTIATEESFKNLSGKN